MTNATLTLVLIQVLLTGLGLWLGYYLLKCAIRDGIRESGLIDRVRRPLPTPHLGDDTMPGPDMRAER